MLFGLVIRRMWNISGKETAHPRRALDNTENHSVFIFPHVRTTVLDIRDVQTYGSLLSVDSSVEQNSYLLIVQIIGCLFACTVCSFLLLDYKGIIIISYLCKCAQICAEWNWHGAVSGSECYRYSILLRSGILYWHICDSNTLIQPNESVLYNAEIEFVKIESGYVTD